MMNTLPKDWHANEFIALVRTIYGEGFIPLHRPVFSDEGKLLHDAKTPQHFDKTIIESYKEEIVLLPNFPTLSQKL